MEHFSHILLFDEESACKLPRLIKKDVYLIINCSKNKENIFPTTFKYIKNLNPIDIKMFTDDEIIMIRDVLIKKNVVIIHSEDINKTKMIYCIICMLVSGIRLDILIKMFERVNPWDPFCQKLTNLQITELRSFEFIIFKDDTLSKVNKSTQSNLTNIKNNKRKNTYDSYDQQLINLYNDEMNLIKQSTKNNQINIDFDNIMMILCDKTDPVLVREMLNTGMKIDDIINYFMQ